MRFKMTNAELKFYVGVTEYGTVGNPISFSSMVAGVPVVHPLSPFYLWNDKGGSLDCVPAKLIRIEVLDMWIQDEVVGASDGSPSQEFAGSVFPVIDTGDPEEIIVTVGSTHWTRVSSFVGTTPTAEIYMFDSTTCNITFGDGVNGLIPPNLDTIYITYMPDLLVYGKEVYENTWLEVMSFGVTANTVAVVDEQRNATDTTHVIVANTTVLSVVGVWLASDTGHYGTNYYTGGSFDPASGLLTLGSALPTETEAVLINYSYIPIDDLESVYTPIGKNASHYFTNQIPKNNAKLLFLRLNVPPTATPSGGSNINFRLKLSYRQ